MRKLRISYLLFAVAFSFVLYSCTKKDEAATADFEAKKASSDKLVQEISTNMTTMKGDHDKWLADLNQAWSKPGADTAKINGYKNDIAQHEQDGQKVMALVDSVKHYSGMTPANNDEMKMASDRLGANFDDLNSQWKSFQDKHASLAQNIQQYAINAAGDAVKDTAKTAAGTTTTATSKNTEKTTSTSSSTTHENAKHSTGGAAPHSAGNPAPSNGTPAAHENTNHSSGGAAPHSAGTTTKK